jgi:hypothetical protein
LSLAYVFKLYKAPKGDANHQGQNIYPGPRQGLSDHDLLTYHPPHLTDTFTFHLKAVVLMARVVQFNAKNKIRLQSDINNGTAPLDASFIPGTAYSDNIQLASTPGFLSSGNDTDPRIFIRSLPEFKALDEMISTFQACVPREYRDPFRSTTGALDVSVAAHERSVDIHLYVAQTLPALQVTYLFRILINVLTFLNIFVGLQRNDHLT